MKAIVQINPTYIDIKYLVELCEIFMLFNSDDSYKDIPTYYICTSNDKSIHMQL